MDHSDDNLYLNKRWALSDHHEGMEGGPRSESTAGVLAGLVAVEVVFKGLFPVFLGWSALL